MDNFHFCDYKPESLSLLDSVVSGLSQPAKSIPPKFFYDERGSKLFEQICEQPEYYPPRVERQMLSQYAGEIAGLSGQGRILIEPGAGSGAKVRLLLPTLRPAAFVPMDISCTYLRGSARQLASEFPWMQVHAACEDFTHSLTLPDKIPPAPRMVFFPGSSLGNFNHEEAHEFLRLMQATLGENGLMLIGVDTKKNSAILNAAYNDAAGITAQFNLNLLYRIRDELGASINPKQFRHHAFYNEPAGRIEMHLISLQKQQVMIDDQAFDFAANESIHTENSYKYAPDEFIHLAQQSGFKSIRYWLGEDDLFALYLLQVD